MPNPAYMPSTIPISAFSLVSIRTKEVASMEGRRTETSEFGAPFWRAVYGTTWLTPANLATIDVFASDMASAGATFLAFDMQRPRPQAHDTGSALSGTKAGGGAFDGSGDIDTITDANTIVISGLPASFAFTAGDYIEFYKSAFERSLHRIRADASANGSGVATVSIRPSLDTSVFTTSHTFNLEKPACVMAVDEPIDVPKAWEERRATFSATEVFYTS